MKGDEGETAGESTRTMNDCKCFGIDVFEGGDKGRKVGSRREIKDIGSVSAVSQLYIDGGESKDKTLQYG